MMYNLLYNYNNNDDDFITAHSRAIINPLIFKVLLCIPLSPQIYGKNSLKALSDPTLTKPNGDSYPLGLSGLDDPIGAHFLLRLETFLTFSDRFHPALAS